MIRNSNSSESTHFFSFKNRSIKTGHLLYTTQSLIEIKALFLFTSNIQTFGITLQIFHLFSRCLRAFLADLQKRWNPPYTHKTKLKLSLLLSLSGSVSFIPSYWFIQLQNCFDNRNVATFKSKTHFRHETRTTRNIVTNAPSIRFSYTCILSPVR